MRKGGPKGGEIGRSDMIRTCDPCVPNAVLCQAELHSDLNVAVGGDMKSIIARNLAKVAKISIFFKK